MCKKPLFTGSVSNTYTCEQCNPVNLFYVTKIAASATVGVVTYGKCTARANVPTNVRIWNPNRDTPHICNAPFFYNFQAAFNAATNTCGIDKYHTCANCPYQCQAPAAGGVPAITACGSCVGNFYVSGGGCTPYTPGTTGNCATFSKTSNVCLTCNTGYFLDALGTCNTAFAGPATFLLPAKCKQTAVSTVPYQACIKCDSESAAGTAKYFVYSSGSS